MPCLLSIRTSITSVRVGELVEGGGVGEVEILKSKDIRITCSTNLSYIPEDTFKFKGMFFTAKADLQTLCCCV